MIIKLKSFFTRTIVLGILLTTIPSTNQWSNFPIGNTFFWWVFYFLILFSLVRAKKYFYENSVYHKIIFLYLCWVSICIVRGFFIAENYWEWRSLIQKSFYLLMPLSIYVFSNKFILNKIIFSWVKYVFPLFVFFLFFLDTEAYGRFFVPISFLALFFPALNLKWKIIVVAITAFIVLSDFTARSNIIKSVFPIIFGLIYYFRFFLSTTIFKLIHFLIYSLPILLLFLALNGTFNIFQMQEYIETDIEVSSEKQGEETTSSIIADTRTFIYAEVIDSALKNNYTFFGRTPARGYDSEIFGDYVDIELQTGKSERFSSEVAHLNIFTWLGLVGLILYNLIFLISSYLAVYKSKNIYIKIVGLYVAFRCTYSWVEEFSRFDLTNIFLWMTIAICFSEPCREMTNHEFKFWIRGVFQNQTQTTRTI